MKNKLLSWEKDWNKTNPYGAKVIVKTGHVKDIKLHKVSSKKITHAGLNLAVGYMVLPFIKFKGGKK